MGDHLLLSGHRLPEDATLTDGTAHVFSRQGADGVVALSFVDHPEYRCQVGIGNSLMVGDKLVGMMEENSNITIELSSHCDYRGNDQYNARLAQRRAESVVNYMIEHGVAKDRLTAMGYGEARPKVIRKKLAEAHSFLNEGDTLTEAFIKKLKPAEQEICNALNRRTEFQVLRTTYGMTIEELQSQNKEATKQSERQQPANNEDDNFIF